MAERPSQEPVKFIPYEILLPERPGREFARLVLPADLTAPEAERLCGVIRSLAFPDVPADDR
jgi:hypothetical protein